MITLSLCSLPPCLLFLFHFLPPPPLLPASIPLLPGLEYKAPGTSHCSPHRSAKPQGEHTSTACTLCVALPPQKKQRGAGISIYECSPLSLLLTCTCSHNLFVFFLLILVPDRHRQQQMKVMFPSSHLGALNILYIFLFFPLNIQENK